jgi:hypothetical protein
MNADCNADFRCQENRNGENQRRDQRSSACHSVFIEILEQVRYI